MGKKNDAFVLEMCLKVHFPNLLSNRLYPFFVFIF